MILIISRLLRNKQCYCLQDPTTWIQKLLSTAIMGLILTISFWIFMRILNALRNLINFPLKYNCKTEQDTKEDKESRKTQLASNATDYYKPSNITGQIIWKKEQEPPEYETIIENAEEDTLLTTEEKNHQTEQEIKDLQGTVKSLQKEITTHYPLMQN